MKDSKSEEFYLIENFITNVDEIISLCEKYKDRFSDRSKGASNEFISDRYGPSKLHTLFKINMPKDLIDTILKTIDKKHLEIPPDEIIINKYDPGSYLVKHRDHTGGSYDFKLIFLRTDQPHLKVYNSKYPQGKLVEEKPGALFVMPLSLEHEVTVIEEWERPKYSLVLTWEI